MEHFLDFAGWWTAERTNVLINATIALIALVSLLVARRSLRLNRQISINANRPMMMAEVLMPDYAKETLRLMVSNRGKSVAKNVKVSFDPDLPNTTGQNEATGRGSHYSPIRRVKSIFSNTVFSTWVPGHQVDVAYWLQPEGKLLDGDSISDSAEGVPGIMFALLEYDDELNNHYSERFELNVRSVIGSDFRTNSITTNGKLNFEKQLSRDIQENNRMLGRISRKL